MKNITEDIKYIGVNDHVIDLFESQYAVPNGMAYNSYVILDEKLPFLTLRTAVSPTNGSVISKPLSTAGSPIIS